MSNWWEGGRTPFPIRDGNNDYSGTDIESVYLVDSTSLTHAFLNGTKIVASAFVNCSLDQVELAESEILDTTFSNVDFSGSDFVRTSLKRAKFENCSFTNGEWRETQFENVSFVRCNFSHTTINLCNFRSCEFLAGSTASMNHRALNYNTFSQCTFADPIASQYVLSNNFGLPTKQRIVVQQRGRSEPPSLREICAASGTDEIRTEDIVGAIERECTAQQARSNKLVLEFMSNIISMLAAERRISPASMTYVEELFIEVAQSATSAENFQAAMNAVIGVRNAIYDSVMSRKNHDPYSQGYCHAVALRYSDTYDREDAIIYGRVLSEIFFGKDDLMRLEKFEVGSTFIEYICGAAIPVATVISVLNLLLIRGSVLIQKSLEIKEAWKALIGTRQENPIVQSDEPVPDKLPAVLRTGAVVPGLVPVRIAIQKNGRAIVRLDERVEITIFH
jgi:Pentapeptide repeats (9 copies)